LTLGDAPETAILAGLHVLVVDDDQDSRQIIGTTLRAFDALVTTAASAQSAYRRLSEVTPDVIVCDLAMPERDGVAFARDVRATPGFSSTPMLAVTAYDHRFPLPELQRAGFTAVMRKPIDPPHLASVVAALAHGRPP
jgi:CheY-like chemotaxis protein